MTMKMFIAVVLLVFMLFFVAQNTGVVAINILVWRLEASRAIIFLVVFLVGVATGWLGNTWRRWYLKNH